MTDAPQAPDRCEDCGWPIESFACRIRHQGQPIIGWGKAVDN